MVNLKGLPDALRGVVWSSSARTMKRPVNSGNERDHIISCNFPFLGGHSNETALETERKEWATVDLYGPNTLGLHAAYNG